jgi:D-3-phosphoglycerate dehydrogenase / 2-oxoglutarate reductase
MLITIKEQEMSAFRIKKINAISKEGLKLFSEDFKISPDETDPQGILVRSSPVNVDEYPSLLAVARAGPGSTTSMSTVPPKKASVSSTPPAPMPTPWLIWSFR